MRNFILFFIIAVFVTITSCSDCFEQKTPNLGCGYKLDDYEKYSFAIVDSENNVIVATHIIEYLQRLPKTFVKDYNNKVYRPYTNHQIM